MPFPRRTQLDPHTLLSVVCHQFQVTRRGKLPPIGVHCRPPLLAISTWLVRRWPGLQRANQVRVAGTSASALRTALEAPKLQAGLGVSISSGHRYLQRTASAFVTPANSSTSSNSGQKDSNRRAVLQHCEALLMLAVNGGAQSHIPRSDTFSGFRGKASIQPPKQNAGTVRSRILRQGSKR
jgi:hypothetical protein